MFFDWSALKKLIWLRAAGIIGAVWKTITNAAVASFTAVAAPVRELVVDIDPVQDLHWYDSPWPAGGRYNQLNEADLVNGKWISPTSGNVNNEPARKATVNYQPCQPSTAYFFATYDPATKEIVTGAGYNMDVAWYEEDKTFISAVNANLSNATLTSPANAAYFRVGILSQSHLGAVNYPATEKSYSPYSNVCPITGWTGANVTRTGKNLLDQATYITSTSTSWQSFSLQLKPNTQYTVSSDYSGNRFRVLADNTNLTKTEYPNNGTPITFTTNDVALVTFGYYSPSSGDKAPSYHYQIELGNKATAYEPYSGTTIPVSWETEAGTVYGGALDVTTGVLTVTDVILVLNSADMNNNEDNPGWKDAGIKALIGAGKTGVIYRPTNCGDRYTVRTDGTGSASDRVLLPISIYGLTQTQWIALAMDVQILVPLATPTTYKLTPTEVTTLLGQNNVWADTGNINSLTYRADVELYIAKKLAEA